MENNLQNANPAVAPTQPTAEQGRWVPVDASQLGFELNGEPNKPIVGPDNATYIISSSAPQYGGVASNNGTAIPTPSRIIQMPPIVQPIALVPYASQNQPLLQYDPYSRPVVPQSEAPVSPVYIPKPYRGLSITNIFFALIAILAICFLDIVSGAKLSSSGLDCVKAVIMLFGVKGMTSVYYTSRISPFIEDIGKAFKSDFLSTFVTLALPIFVTLIIIIAIYLIIKYIVRASKGRSPRNFSLGAAMMLALSLSLVFIIFGLSRGADGTTTIANFASLKSAMYIGAGLFVVIACSLLLLIIPFFAKKYAHIIDNKEKNRTVIIKD